VGRDQEDGRQGRQAVAGVPVGGHVEQHVEGEEAEDEGGRTAPGQHRHAGHEQHGHREVGQEDEDHGGEGPRAGDGAVGAALQVDDRLAVRGPERRHLVPQLLEDPPRLPLEDRLDRPAAGVLVLRDAPVHRPVLLVHLLAAETRVPLPEVEGPRGGDRHEGLEDEPVAHRPRRDHEDRRCEQPGRAPGTPGPPPGQPQGGHGQEVEHRFASEDGEPEEDARDRGGARRGPGVGREQPLHRPPQQGGEEGLRPEVRGEPDELGVERGEAGRGEAGPLAERARPGEPGRGDEQGPGEALGDLDRDEAPEQGGQPADEVEVERRVEDEPQAQGGEADVEGGEDLRAPGQPHRLVGHREGGRLEGHPEKTHREPGQGQGQQAPAEGRGHARDLSTTRFGRTARPC
jgi:hypothetical protein